MDRSSCAWIWPLVLAAGASAALAPRLRRGRGPQRWRPPAVLRKPGDLEFCAARGLADTSPYRDVFPLVDKLFMPVYSSQPLTGIQSTASASRAVLWMHGVGMDANRYFCDAIQVARENGAEESTLSIVPWFYIEPVTGAQWMGDRGRVDDAAISIHWHEDRFFHGGRSSFDGCEQVLADRDSCEWSSFAVWDKMIESLRSDSSRYPDLQKVFLVGFSGGGQFLQKYAFFSDAVYAADGGPKVTVLAGSPGSYMYLTPLRPGRHCVVARDTGANHSCDSFQAVPHAARCWYFDMYKHGLGGDPIKDTIPYVSDALRNASRISELYDAYRLKDFRLLLGDQDACSCNAEGYQNGHGCFPETTRTCGPNAHGGTRNGYGCCDSWPHESNELTSDCATDMQGTNRLQRGLNYLSHLRHFYKARSQRYEPTYAFFQGAHNSSAAFSSEAFRSWVFG